MPNYVTNNIHIDGPPEQVAALFDQIAFDGRPGTFDFNKVVPMPESLDLTEGSITDSAIDAYLSAINPDNDFRIGAIAKADAAQYRLLLLKTADARRFIPANGNLTEGEVASLAKTRHMTTPEELAELGKRYVANVHEHGAATWYGWRTANWGTKWNNDPDEPVANAEAGTITFDTAWSMPEPVVEELSHQFPELTFAVSWADEDIGYNVGAREYRSGEVVGECLPEPGSPEAEAMAYDIKGCNDDVFEVSLSLHDLMSEAQKRAEKRSSSAWTNG